ncbi:SDR family oxidoreductase [Streptomyces sp. Lzd4kr]|nr:SDR family oxidoreductase [Streptomyces sp. Lzd4kr]
MSGPALAQRSLAGKVAVVTGAGGALGRAICRQFAADGAEVVGVDLPGQEGCRAADISSEEDNRRLVADVVAEYGRLDIVVLNAGVQHLDPIRSYPGEQWARLMGVMLTGPFLTMKAAWPHLTARPGGRVLATASTSSYAAEKYKAGYVSAKHGLLGLIKVAALEGAEHGLTANAVAPSWMRTGMVEQQVARRSELLGRSPDDVIADLVGEQAVKRFVEPDEVAQTLAFLASPAASGITGSCIPVDLGALA